MKYCKVSKFTHKEKLLAEEMKKKGLMWSEPQPGQYFLFNSDEHKVMNIYGTTITAEDGKTYEMAECIWAPYYFDIDFEFFQKLGCKVKTNEVDLLVTYQNQSQTFKISQSSVNLESTFEVILNILELCSK